MSFKPSEITNEILDAAAKQGRELTPLQVVKLAYIAHGWWLAYHRRGLVNDTVEAWKFGPVFPVIYRMLRRFGRGPVVERMRPAIFERGEAITDNVRKFIKSLVRGYGHLDGMALSNLTHQPGTPWSHVYRPDLTNIEIPDDIIRNHYVSLWQQRVKNDG